MSRSSASKGRLQQRGGGLGRALVHRNLCLAQTLDDGVQRGAKLLRRCIAPVRIFGESAVDNSVECGGMAGEAGAQRGMRRVDELVQYRQVFAAEGQMSGQQQVEHDSSRKNVGTAVERLALQALRGHVVDRADESSGSRQPAVGALYPRN